MQIQLLPKNGRHLSSLLILLFVYAFYSLIVSLIAFHRYASYQSSWDLGVFTQIFEGLLKIGFPYDSMDLHKNPGGNYLGVHFSPSILIFTPLYFILPSPITLLVIQTLFYSAGIIPLYLLVKEWFNERSSMLISLSYLIHPGSLYLLLYDFHEISFFPTLFILTAYFYFTKRHHYFLLSLIFSCMVNEFTPIVMCFFSLYILFFNDWEEKGRRKWREKLASLKESVYKRLKSRPFPLLALMISVTMIGVAFYVEYWLNPIWKPQRGWWILGSSLDEIVRNMVTRPDLVLKSLTNDAELKMVTILYLFGPCIFLPLLSGPFLMVFAPWMGAVLLSSSPICTIYLQYHAMNMPLLIIATALGVRRLSKATSMKLEKLITIAFSITVIFTSLIGPFGLVPAPSTCCTARQLLGYRIDLTRKDKHNIYDLFIDLVPENAVVLTQVRFYPQLSDKTPYVLLHIPPKDWDYYDMIPLKEKLIPEYILLDLSERSFNIGALYEWKNGATRYVTPLSSAENILDNTWGILAEYDSIVLYKRGFKEPPIIYGGLARDYGPTELSYGGNEVIFYEGENIIECSGKESIVFWYGPYDFYPPGIYSVTFTLRIRPNAHYEEASDERVLTLDVATDKGKIILASREIRFNELSYEWRRFTIQFKVQLKPLSLEFRGLYPHPSTPIQLQGITVKRVMPYQPFEKAREE